MLYVGIDQHKRHLTICTRDEQGEILLRRQVSTRWEQIDRFLKSLRARSDHHGGYVAIVEVCGFNGWLIERLEQWGCRGTYVIQAPNRVRQKTDRRDAAKLSELLWINRERMAAGDSLVHVSVVYQPTKQEQYDRQLTHLRHRLGQALTRSKNGIKGILRRHNVEQASPTKGTFTQAGLKWLKTLELPQMDRMELDMRLDEYSLYAGQIEEVDDRIRIRAYRIKTKVRRLRTLPKIGEYMALALLAHIGSIERFERPRSLSNYFGITPGCRNSGETDRPGSITKAGHPFIRFLLAQMVLHALRGDPGLRAWYRRVKRRRGSKIARVAVMRRLCESIWHMLTNKEDYRPVDVRTKDGANHRRRSAA
ncbi:MAG: IS110 family transposase [Phycisphaerae bacterium]